MKNALSSPFYLSTCISASAGSGKTYQLVLRYLSLLAMGAEPSRIIALTFTRKAAGEFTQRILLRLAEAAHEEKKAESLARDIKRTLLGEEGVQPPLLSPQIDRNEVESWEWNQAFFQALLHQMLRSLGQLKLLTLDSFFGQMMGLLSLDLGMGKIEVLESDAAEEAQEKALEALYCDSLLSVEQKEEFWEILQRSLVGRETEKIHDSLQTFIKEYYSLYLAQPHRSAWGEKSSLWRGGEPIWAQGCSRAELPSLYAQLRTQIEEASFEPVSGKPNPEVFREALATALEQIFAYGQEKQTDPNTLFKALFTQETFVSLAQGKAELKYNRSAFFIPPLLGQTLLSFLLGVLRAKIERALLRTQGLFDCLEKYDLCYNEQVRRQGKLMFDDMSRYLSPQSRGGILQDEQYQQALEWLKFRLDGWYDHWLLDEFQDTSFSKWAVLKDLVEEVAQEEKENNPRSLFVVGDGKQSLYQWTGAAPEVFAQFWRNEPWRSFFEPWYMNVSYRSAPAIMDFVNECCDFKKRAQDLDEKKKKEVILPKALENWTFQPHRAFHKNLTGCVEVRELKRAERGERPMPSSQEEGAEGALGEVDERALLALKELLLEIRPWQRAKESGEKMTSAILVRTGDQARKIKEWLLSQGEKIPVEEENDVYIGLDSPLGQAFKNFFVWLLHPADVLAWEHLKLSPLEESLQSWGNPAYAWQHWKAVYENEGLEGVLFSWEGILEEKELLTPFARNRWEAWKKAALLADEKGMTLEEWVASLPNIKRRERATSQSVQIMTIHKSKGLEFDVVFLPVEKGEKSFDSKNHLKAFASKDLQTGQLLQVLQTADSKVHACDPLLSAWEKEWSAEQQFSGMCVLYVALTRAARACYVLLPSKADKSSLSCRRETLVREACEGQELAGQNEEQAKEFSSLIGLWGEPSWYRFLPLCASNQQEESFLAPVKLPSWSGQSGFVSPSSLGHTFSPPKSLKGEFGARGKRFGEEVHVLFERLDWLEASERVGEDWPEGAARDCVLACLGEPQIRTLFEKPHGLISLWKERDLLGEWQGKRLSGVIDRAWRTQEGIGLVDFKSDRVGSAEELLSLYREQILCYKGLLAQAYGLEEGKVQAFLLSTHLRELIPVL